MFIANVLSTWGKSPSLLKRLRTGLWPFLRLSAPTLGLFSSSGFHDTGQHRKEAGKKAPEKKRWEAHFSLRTKVESKRLVPSWFRVGASQERKKKQNMVVNLKSGRTQRTEGTVHVSNASLTMLLFHLLQSPLCYCLTL